jgi:hypothetical protein
VSEPRNTRLAIIAPSLHALFRRHCGCNSGRDRDSSPKGRALLASPEHLDLQRGMGEHRGTGKEAAKFRHSRPVADSTVWELIPYRLHQSANNRACFFETSTPSRLGPLIAGLEHVTPSAVYRRRAFRRLAGSLVLLSVVFFGSAGQAHAYADPGSGALVWQMLVAGFVGALYYFRKFASRLMDRKNQPGLNESPLPQHQCQTELSRSEK